MALILTKPGTTAPIAAPIKTITAQNFQQNVQNQMQNQQNFANLIGNAIGQAMQTQNQANQMYTTDLSGGQIINTYKIPNTLNWTATSAAGSGAQPVTMYIFNEDTFTASPTTNGSAAGSVTHSYGDGANGKLYNQLLKFPGDSVGKGILVYGFNIIFTDASTQVQDPNGLSAAQFTWSVANGYGKFIPETIDLTPGVNPGNYQDGLLRIKYPVYLNDIGQISLNLPVGDQVSVTFFTTPMQ